MTEEETKKESGGKAGFLKRYWHIIFLVLLILFFTLNNAYFIAHDRSPIVADSAEHLPKALSAYEHLGKIDRLSQWEIFNLEYPPLLYFVTVVFFKLFGVSMETALWSIYPFSLIFILACFATGSRFGGKSGAVAAALLGTANCYIINYSHLYMMDLPHAALTGAAFYFLLKSDMFKIPSWAYLSGFSLGLALLCRFSSIFYFAGPLAVVAAYYCFRSLKAFLLSLILGGGITGMVLYFFFSGKQIFRAGEESSKHLGEFMFVLAGVSVILVVMTIIVQKVFMKKWNPDEQEQASHIIGGARALILTLLVALPFYLNSMTRIMNRLTWHFDAHRADTPGFVSTNLLFNYYTMNNFFPLIFLLVIAGITLIFFRKKMVPYFILLGAMGVSGFFLTTFLASPFSRYLLVEVLVFAVLGGYWVEYAGKVKLPALAFITAYSILIIGFPFFSPAVPLQFWEIYGIENHPPIYLEPTYPTNPDPDNARIFAMTGEIKGEYEKSLSSRHHQTGFFFQAQEGFEIEQRAGRKYADRGFKELYGRHLLRALWIKGVPMTMDGSMEGTQWQDYFRGKRETPVFLVTGYLDRNYPVELTAEITKQTGREIKLIKKYTVKNKKKVNLYLVYP